MGRTVVQTGACGERDASIQAILLDQATVCLLDSISDFHDRHAGSDEALSVLASLSVDFGGTTKLLVIFLEELLFGTELLTIDSVLMALTIVLLNLTDGEVAIWVLL